LRHEPNKVPKALAFEALRLKRDAVLQEDVGMVRAGLGADQDEALARRVHELRDREHRESVQDLLHLGVMHRLAHELGVWPLRSGGAEDVRALMHGAASETARLVSVPRGQSRRVVLDRVKSVTANLPRRTPPVSMLLPMAGVSQVYARSLEFGYCLRRVTERFELETMMHSSKEEGEQSSQLGSRPAGMTRSWNGRAFSSVSLPPLNGATKWGVVSSSWRSGDHRLASKSMESADFDLKRSTPTVSLQEFAGSYLQTMGMQETADGEFLSLEARAVCANYTKALFGEPDELRSDITRAIGSAGSEEEARRNVEWAMRTGIVDAMELPIRGIQRLVLEAVAYGMFLWDVERTVRMHAE